MPDVNRSYEGQTVHDMDLKINKLLLTLFIPSIKNQSEYAKIMVKGPGNDGVSCCSFQDYNCHLDRQPSKRAK